MPHGSTDAARTTGSRGSGRGGYADERGWILGIGEILWDLLPSGPRLGGAPFNVVAHLARLGHRVTFLTAVGSDELGHEALGSIGRFGVDPDLVVVAGLPTGTVEVTLDSQGQPGFVIISPAAYEAASVEPAALERIAAAPPTAVVFGTLAQRSPLVRRATRQVLEAAPATMRVYDTNLREGTWSVPLIKELLADATVLKLNDAEVEMLAPLLELPELESEFAAEVAARFDLEAVCVTRGGSGALLWMNGRGLVAPGVRIEVADTIGAGDAFTAGMVDGLVRGRPPVEILATANALGAFVASRTGAIPDWTRADLENLGAVLEPPRTQG